MDSTLLWLTQLGIPTLKQTIITTISPNVQRNIPLPKQLPKDIGRIIGLSTYCDTVDPQNNPLITTAQAQILFLALKSGATEFYTPVRLDDLLFNFAGVPSPSGLKYHSVNIPGDFDLSTSYYINPTLIVSAAAPAPPITIMLNLLYINVNTYKDLIARDIVLQNGISQKELNK